MGCPGGSDRKESACNATDLGQEDPPEKGKAAHSGILAWRIPWTKESSGLQSLESQRVEHNLETNVNFKCIKYIQILRNHHPSPEHFSSCKTETLHPLNTDCLASGIKHSILCLYEFDFSRNLKKVE